MAVSRDMPVLERLRQAAREKTAMDPKLMALLAGGAGAVGAGIPIALLMKAHENHARERSRNIGFGAGVATGLAGPHIARGLYGLTQGGSQ
jgi:hypothetical protein